MKNYYRILQVDREAEQEVISAAYRRLVQKYHPDQNPQTEERMKEINEAYEILSDPNRRAVHDRKLREHEGSSKKKTNPGASKESPKKGRQASSPPRSAGSDSSIATLEQLEKALIESPHCGRLTPEIGDFQKAKLVSKLSDGHFVYHLAHWAGGQNLYVTSSARSFDSIVLAYYGAFFGRAEIFEILNKLPKL